MREGRWDQETAKTTINVVLYLTLRFQGEMRANLHFRVPAGTTEKVHRQVSLQVKQIIVKMTTLSVVVGIGSPPPPPSANTAGMAILLYTLLVLILSCGR